MYVESYLIDRFDPYTEAVLDALNETLTLCLDRFEGFLKAEKFGALHKH